MDVRGFFRKVKEVEATIPEDHVVVVSQETPDGGVAGRFTEVSRHNAARLIVEGRAKLADAGEAATFRAERAQENDEAIRRMAAERIRVTLVHDFDPSDSKVRNKGQQKDR